MSIADAVLIHKFSDYIVGKVPKVDACTRLRHDGDSEGSSGIWDVWYGVFNTVTDESGCESSSAHGEGSKHRAARASFT